MLASFGVPRAAYAQELMMPSQAKLIGWYSEAGSQQLGALFAFAKMLNTRHAVADKFVRAYCRGAADYADMLPLDWSGKRMFTIGTRETATIIARYAFPAGRSAAQQHRSKRPRHKPKRGDRCRRTWPPTRIVPSAEADRDRRKRQGHD